MMRVFSSLVTAFAVCVALLAATPSEAKGARKIQTKPKPASQVENPVQVENRTPARAHSNFATPEKPGKPGQKMAGMCSIDCGGYGTTVWAENVGDCACQCSSYCGTSCNAWEVYGPGTASCSMQ
jgi:hypothetical protein